MAKIIMTCGKICSGKSTYAEQMRKKNNGVILSVDEIMLILFGQHAGEKHDEYVRKIKTFLYEKSVELAYAGVNVILDWGYWTKEERSFAKEFYGARKVENEIHYLDISDEVWNERLERRNKAVLAGESQSYFVDENLARKFEAIFEKPDETEIDVWVRC